MNQLHLLEAPPPVDAKPTRFEPWNTYGNVALYHGDSLDVLRSIPANSIDALMTDPPYGIGFMGQEWDTFNPDKVRESKRFQVGRGDQRITSNNPNVNGRSHSPAVSPSQIEYDRTIVGQRGFQAFTMSWALEVLRVLKPGAHGLVCGAPRSAHRLVCGLEDAGFEVRDSFAWLFGQGFPKSHNLDGGLGSALKPGHEPITLIRKPFNGTIEQNIETWGTGALNIEACRLNPGTTVPGGSASRSERSVAGGDGHALGRWPANVLLDEAASAQLDAQSGHRPAGASPRKKGLGSSRVFGSAKRSGVDKVREQLDAGGASRFFYVAKPSRFERDFGCDELPMLTPGECTEREEGSAGITPYAGAGRSGGGRNFHPTVKPVDLMRYGIRLITPPGGVVIDLFLGSGTTGMAALVDGHPFIGIERELRYLTIADARIGATHRELIAEFVCGESA